jgi:hypothetical protein
LGIKSLILAKLAIKIRLLSLKFTLKLKSILSKSNKVSIKLILKLSLINKEAIKKLLNLIKEVHLTK